jgi:hypothetical protein
MKWIASEKNPPIYVWWGDEWYNETDKRVYYANKSKMAWVSSIDEKMFHFTKKTKLLSKD